MASDFERKVIRQLINRRSRNNIIMMVCQERGWQWPEAEAFVTALEGEHAEVIANIQRGYFRWFSVGFVLAGIILMLAAVVFTLSGIIIILLRLPIPYLGNVLLFLFGLGLTAGGIIGWYQTHQDTP
jgi:hypothetical protein